MAAYQYADQAFAHRLTPLKGWFEEGALDAEVTLTSNVNINSTGLPAVSGLCIHLVGKTSQVDAYGSPMTGPPVLTAEMGCGAGHGMPLWLWPNSTDPDVYNPGVPSTVPAYGTTAYNADFVSVMPPAAGGNMPALVASGGYELETTEFDTAQTYGQGNGLRAVTSNTNVNAGKLTNQGATSAAFTTATLAYGDPTLSAWDTIVGFVSRGAYVNANRKSSLGFYPFLIPGTR